MTEQKPTTEQLDNHIGKLVSEYAFGPDDQCDSPDALTMVRASLLREMLEKRIPVLVTEGENPCAMTWPEILPDLDLKNWYPCEESM